MEDLPIDIHYAKLLDWLLDRKKVPAGWHSSVRSIRVQINEALEELPETTEVKDYVRGRFLDYFGCKEIVRLLSRSQKDIFGRYKDDRAKVWPEIVAAYEKDDIFLAESAQLLARQVDVEIPSTRKRIAKLQSSLNDAGRREADTQRTAKKQEAELVEMCSGLGIQDPSLPIEGQLSRAVQISAPKIAREVAELVKQSSIEDALHYYEAYVQRAGSSYETLCATLALIRSSDIADIAPEAHVISGADVKEVEIDWGDLASTAAEPQIDFGDADEPKIDFGEPTINFGDETAGGMKSNPDQEGDSANAEPTIDLSGFGTTAEDVANNGSTDEPTINWGNTEDDEKPIEIDWGDAGDTGGAEVVQVHTATAVAGETVQLEEDTKTSRGISLLEDENRHALLTDLYELQEFLQQRAVEWKGSSRGGGLGLLLLEGENKNAELKKYDLEKIGSMREAVDSVIAQLTAGETKQVLTLKSSSRALQRLVKKLEDKKLGAEKLKRMVIEIEQRRDREAEEIKELGPRLESIIHHVKELKANIETALSNQYKPRKVNLMGEINTL